MSHNKNIRPILLRLTDMHNSSEKGYMVWFIMSDDEISGPFDKDYVQNTCDESSLIWGASMPEWMNKRGWIQHLKNPTPLKPKAAVKTPAPVISNKTSTKTAAAVSIAKAPAPAAQEPSHQWFYTSNKEKFGPFKEKELVQMLNMLNFSEPVYLWRKGLETWKPVESITSVYSKLNASAKAA